jgi:sugar lactone lactonase YvrE
MKTRKLGGFLVLGLALISGSLRIAAGQKIEVINGVRVVHNEKGGGWGSEPAIKIELVRTIGGLEEKDPNLAFNAPYDIDVDSAGNIYILDFGNNRIQKLDSEGRFLQTIGRAGQGPGELQGAFSLDIDEQGLLYVAESRNLRLQIFKATGKPLRQIKLKNFGVFRIRRLPADLIVKGGGVNLRAAMEKPKKLAPLLELIDLNGKVKKTFGEAMNYKDALVNSEANHFELDADFEGNIYLSFWHQNRIDKYAPDGTPLWRADRPLNYGTEVISKGRMERSERGTSIQAPILNMVSMGIAADAKGRVWVNTYHRQMTKEERGSTLSAGGATRTMREGKTAKMDIHKLEVLDRDGILLGEIPLNHLAHGIRIVGDKLFVWERTNAIFYQYRIVESERKRRTAEASPAHPYPRQESGSRPHLSALRRAEKSDPRDRSNSRRTSKM